jgi:hypothetical protein
MGRSTFSRSTYAAATEAYVPRSGPATRAAEEQVRRTGQLNELVDPAGFGVIRRSLVRFDELPDGRQELTVGCSMPVETRLDTTGSMGDNVDRALGVLPDLYELCSQVLPGYDVHLAIGIFGDAYSDQFCLCRPQFEMEAGKIVEQLTLMNPERNGGGNGGEDPHYGLFGAAYLTRAYVNEIGLRRYDFTISDEPAREQLEERVLTRVFGDGVFDKADYNGFGIDRHNLPSTKEVIEDLLKQAHAFFLEVDGWQVDRAHQFWVEHFGQERVIVLPRIELLPQVQAVIIGLTEGTFALDQVGDFMIEHQASPDEVVQIQRAVANIPIGAQVPLREAIVASGHQIPEAGDIFAQKPDVFAGTNLWPISQEDVAQLQTDSNPGQTPDTEGEGPNWL